MPEVDTQTEKNQGITYSHKYLLDHALVLFTNIITCQSRNAGKHGICKHGVGIDRYPGLFQCQHRKYYDVLEFRLLAMSQYGPHPRVCLDRYTFTHSGNWSWWIRSQHRIFHILLVQHSRSGLFNGLPMIFDRGSHPSLEHKMYCNLPGASCINTDRLLSQHG